MNEDTQIHLPYEQRDPYGALSHPLYQTVAYEFTTAEEMALAFQGKSDGFTYSRINNPTVQYYEKRVAAMTGAKQVTALSSGMAAVTHALLTVAYAGCNIVTSRHLFGNTYSFLASTLSDFDVEIRFCDLNSPHELERLMDDRTACLFLEIMTNPQLEVADLQALSKLCRQNQIPIIADTTLVPFCSFSASDWGIDIEVVSSTKYLSGGATSLGGLIVDYGLFDWSSSPKLSKLSHVAPFDRFGFKLKREIHRNLGAYMTPQVAHLQLVGLDTLSIRYDKHSENAYQLACYLETHKKVVSVNYCGLTSNPYHVLAVSQFGPRQGAMLTFDLKDESSCFQFMNRLLKIRRATNLFDNKSLIIHPASTIYGTFSAEQRRQMNVHDTTLRLSVGLEPIDSLIADIRQALD